MPGRDGTGPMGMGSRTGRGVGFCASFAAPGYINPGVVCGMGLGRGRGFRRMFYRTGVPGVRSRYTAYNRAFASEVDEKEYLNEQAEILESQLQHVKKRLSTLNGDTE